MILVVALICAVSMVTIAGYFVYTIVPYNRAVAEWGRKYGKLTRRNRNE